MRKLLKTGLVVPVLVLALAFTGFAIQAADQSQNDKKDMNQDLNQDLNATGSDRDSSRGALTMDDSDLNDPGAVATTDAAASARRGSLDRRGRQSTKTNVSLASEKDKWWSSGHNNDDEGGDEMPDDEDEGDDEGGGETPTDPQA